MAQPLREQLKVVAERAVLVHVTLPGRWTDPEDPFRELRALVDTAGATTVGELVQKRRKPVGRTYLGRGKVGELADLVKMTKATLVVFDNDLTPAQIRSLEQECEVKIIDRSELILDIFANRATTHAAKLQVEIAQLEYTYPRLRAMWDHLGQVTGGAPVGIGTRGPGEKQIEIDRRLARSRLRQLRRELEEIQERKVREVQVRNDEHFTVGLVGYTNAGKSTLFNRLTAGGAFAHDQLFATLSTRVERWDMGGGDFVLLSDTVGFIRDLPHHLVASFRSTLEETIDAALLVIVLDAADPVAPMQLATVRETLDRIGATTQPRLLLLNKLDRLEALASHPPEGFDEAFGGRFGDGVDAGGLDRLDVPTLAAQAALPRPATIEGWLEREPGAIPVSAVTGEGLEVLAARVRELHLGPEREVVIELPARDGRAITLLEQRAEVRERGFEGDRVRLRAVVGRRHLEALRRLRAEFTVDGAPSADAIDRLWPPPVESRPRRIPPHERFHG